MYMYNQVNYQKSNPKDNHVFYTKSGLFSNRIFLFFYFFYNSTTQQLNLGIKLTSKFAIEVMLKISPKNLSFSGAV